MVKDELILAADGKLVCPRGRGDSVMEIDLVAILRSEARQQEVQFLTKDKALELQKTFNESWRELKQNIALLKFERDEATAALEEIKAALLLDVVPQILKEKEIHSAKDTREAVMVQRPEYKEALTRMNYITALVDFLEVKAKSFERAYQSARSVSDNGGWLAKNPNFSHQLLAAEEPSQEPKKPEPETPAGDDPYAGFGTPQY